MPGRSRSRPARRSRSASLAEPLGAETIVHFDTDSAPDLKARLDGRAEVSAGERVALTVDLERMHFFDPETEAAIA